MKLGPAPCAPTNRIMNKHPHHKCKIERDDKSPPWSITGWNMTTSQSLRLNPWKDGFVETIKQVEQIYARVNAKTVYFVFNEEDFFEYLYEIDAIALFEAVGSKLVNLESVVIQVNVSSKLPAMSIPPLQGLTSLLVTQKKIKYLTMLGLRLEGSD